MIEQSKELVQIDIFEINLEQLREGDDVQFVRIGQPVVALAQLGISLAVDQAELLDGPLNLHNVAGEGNLHVAGTAHNDHILEGIVRGGHAQSPAKGKFTYN